jgi:glycosyltransferase involved in cell wall biosynthesis
MKLNHYYKKSIKTIIRKISSNSPKIKVFDETIIADSEDLLYLFSKERAKKILVIYYNNLWEPILRFASFFGLKGKYEEQNWLDLEDIVNLLTLSNYRVITTQRKTLLPIYVPFLSKIVNAYIANLPIINSFCLTTYTIAYKTVQQNNNYSVSIVVPARNEAGNISNIVKSIPRFGKSQEIIFVEGGSSDNTWEKINKIVNKSNNLSKISNTKNNSSTHLAIKSFKQKGAGKADAVRLGFSKSSGDILMIYDADMTVDARDLSKFYNALSTGTGEFINGSRLVYPMEKDAMRTLNKAGNKFFSIVFTWLLGQRFKDTLCGTKAIFRKNYLEIVKHRKKYGSQDPFGDFDLIFGAIRQNLKVIEIPVRYKERVYGSTNISRFKHGLQLLKMTWIAFKEFKAW